ncbi:unnamed protein product [Adineta steineri]|uniref:Uncharacterized protein n=1 Tax=Adineta steineri TaxID=433720 RepID=A0A814VPG6_9BILA|nr:unnamed protein product [Adineta steineri]CAF1195305.1 unnamed protein product [Adineta steineri]
MAVAYFELATTACHQLLSSKEDDQQQSIIIFEDINFIKALILNEHELMEMIIMIAHFCYLLHPYLVLLPRVETTFLPVRIQKFVYSSKTKTKMNQSTNVEVCGIYHNNICGIGQEEIYNLDLWTFPVDNKIEEPIFTFKSIVIQQVQGIQSGRCNQDLIESIEPFNELAAYYAHMAIKDLDLNQQHHPLLNTCHSLTSILHSKQIITWHSTQFHLIQLIEHFPHLKPFLIILNKYGSHLKDILIKFLLSATKTQQISHTICQHLQLQYERQTKDDNSFENYRLRIFWLTDSHCSDVLSILDLLLNLSQQTGNQDLINFLIALRRLLVPNGLLLLLELVHIPLYFDLIFGFNDQWWSSSDDDNCALNNIQPWVILLKQIEGFNIIESTLNQNENIICFGISVLLTTYKQVYIIFAWQLDQVLSNENNDDLALKQNEELLYGSLSRILQTIQKSSSHFYPFVYFLTDHAQFNNDSNLNIIPSPFIGLERSLITEYE